MAAPTVVVRGVAVVEGVNGSFDAILYAIQQTGKGNQNFGLEIVLNESGYDVGWLARNEHLIADWTLKLVDRSTTSLAANAKAPSSPTSV